MKMGGLLVQSIKNISQGGNSKANQQASCFMPQYSCHFAAVENKWSVQLCDVPVPAVRTNEHRSTGILGQNSSFYVSIL